MQMNLLITIKMVELRKAEQLFQELRVFGQFAVVQSLGRAQLFATPWTAARQASLSITISQSSLKLMSIESMMPSNHLILCRPLLLLPSIFPSIRVFSNESVLCIRGPKYLRILYEVGWPQGQFGSSLISGAAQDSPESAPEASARGQWDELSFFKGSLGRSEVK